MTITYKNRLCNNAISAFLLRIGTVFLLLFFVCQTLKASECYDSHTSKKHKIIVRNKGVYYQFTEKDPNGFSYVKQVNKVLKGIDRSSYKAIGEDESTFMFADKNGFYILPKGEQYEENTAIYSKILGPNANQKHINGRLFFINQKWTYLDAWGKNITRIVLEGLPQNLSNIQCYSTSMYVKSDKQVFVISIDANADKKYKVTEIPNLKPEKVVCYICNTLKNEDYIADENHIFSIRNDGSFEDITPQFVALGLKNNFNTLKFIDANIQMWRNGPHVLKRREGTSVSGKNWLTGEEIDIEYTYSASIPLIPTYGGMSYVLFRNKIYPLWDDNFSQPYDVKTNAAKLTSIEGKLFKGTDFYYFEADDDFKIISTNISADAKFFPGVYSYRGYLPKALVDNNYIHFIGDRFNIHLDNKKALTSQIVKQLGMFYLFNNSLFDGEKKYSIVADYETLSYLGSWVEVINGCADDMPNSEQVEVKYHHFFKDKGAVYYFDEKEKKLKIIQTANPTDYISDDYNSLQELYKIKDVKGVMKEKANRQLNYYLLAGLILGGVGVGAYLLKRR